MLVEIVADPACLSDPSQYDAVLETVADYVPAVQQIKAAVAGGRPLRLLVRETAVAVWLERLAFSYSSAIIQFSSLNARDVLSARWNTEIPLQVTEDAILASGFLEADIVPRSGQSYEEIVLEHYWGEFFTFVRFPLPHAGDLIANLDPGRWQMNHGNPLAMQALKNCQERWLAQAKGRELEGLIRGVLETPAEMRRRLGCFKLLQGYPAKLGQTVLGDWYLTFKNLDVDPLPVDLDHVQVEDAVQEIEYYLNGLAPQVTSRKVLHSILGEMSGWLPAEFEWLLEQLREKGSDLSITPQLLQQIRARFFPIRDQIKDQLADLETAIPPDRPSDPATNRTLQQWLDWAVDQFMPYRFWQEENDRWDREIADYASRYADWFYANYTTNKYQHQNRWVFSLLIPAVASLKAGRKVVFVVVDCLNYKHLSWLLDSFIQGGFQLAGAVEPKLALIPTTTEVSKWCLIAGEPELSDVQGNSYEEILEKDWRPYFGDQQVTYLSKLGDLKKRRRFQEDMILLNYLPVDTVLHKDEREIGASHAAEIRGYLQTLGQELVQFVKRAQVEQDVDIYIASDHGATKIPASVHNVLDHKFYRERATNRHHRYIAVPGSRVSNPTDYDQTHCYIAPADQFGTRDHYFIARGYDRFIDTQESIYVHGGLTPEETIVPFCKLVKTEMEVQQPTIHLPDNVIRYSVKANLVFKVGNPNSYDMTNVELNVFESDLPGVTVEVIPAGIATEVSIPVRIKRRTGVPDLSAITVEGSFELQGQRFKVRPVTIEVEARSLMESKSEFDFDW